MSSEICPCSLPIVMPLHLALSTLRMQLCMHSVLLLREDITRLLPMHLHVLLARHLLLHVGHFMLLQLHLQVSRRLFLREDVRLLLLPHLHVLLSRPFLLHVRQPLLFPTHLQFSRRLLLHVRPLLLLSVHAQSSGWLRLYMRQLLLQLPLLPLHVQLSGRLRPYVRQLLRRVHMLCVHVPLLSGSFPMLSEPVNPTPPELIQLNAMPQPYLLLLGTLLRFDDSHPPHQLFLETHNQIFSLSEFLKHLYQDQILLNRLGPRLVLPRTCSNRIRPVPRSRCIA